MEIELILVESVFSDSRFPRAALPGWAPQRVSHLSRSDVPVPLDAVLPPQGTPIPPLGLTPARFNLGLGLVPLPIFPVKHLPEVPLGKHLTNWQTRRYSPWAAFCSCCVFASELGTVSLAAW